MGDPRKLKRSYDSPKQLWNATRIKEQKKLVSEYGLRNMQELWKAETELRTIRREARNILGAKERGLELRRKNLLEKVSKVYLSKPDITIDDLLALTVRHILDRRLQTIVFKKRMARTMKQARQFIVHRHVLVNGKCVNVPSYIVSFEEENRVEWNGFPVPLDEQVREERGGATVDLDEIKSAKEGPVEVELA